MDSNFEIDQAENYIRKGVLSAVIPGQTSNLRGLVMSFIEDHGTTLSRCWLALDNQH
jgi:hypothetical protein